MATVADLRVGEPTKLRANMREKIPLFLISRKRDAAQQVKESQEAKQQAKREETMSESAMFLLMDRFAPS